MTQDTKAALEAVNRAYNCDARYALPDEVWAVIRYALSQPVAQGDVDTDAALKALEVLRSYGTMTKSSTRKSKVYDAFWLVKYAIEIAALKSPPQPAPEIERDENGHVLVSGRTAELFFGKTQPAPEVVELEGLDLSALRSANKARHIEWSNGAALSLTYRGNELAGETGEACNVLKKLEREKLGMVGSRATLEQAAEELADVVICADLAAMDLGIELDKAVADKFNKTSEKNGLATRLHLQRQRGGV